MFAYTPWAESDLYPPYARTEEERRRWRVATRAVLTSYGFRPGEPLDGLDRAVIWTAQRSIYGSELPTGDGDLSDGEAAWLRNLGLL